MHAGTSILNTVPSVYGTYAILTGTSMASPCIAGIAALLKAADPSLTPSQLVELIESTATDIGAPGKVRRGFSTLVSNQHFYFAQDDEFGYGKVNPVKAAISKLLCKFLAFTLLILAMQRC